jgi:K+-transporting ATPase ATPase A chain
VSFVTNTNWPGYGGESTMSYLMQMAGLTVQNFVSVAADIAMAIAIIRGFARREAAGIGNFWVDFTRATLFVMLPISIVVSLALVALGIPQNLGAFTEAATLEGAKQVIAQGPAYTISQRPARRCRGFRAPRVARPERYRHPG